MTPRDTAHNPRFEAPGARIKRRGRYLPSDDGYPLTVEEIAELLHVTVRAAVALIDQGALPTVTTRGRRTVARRFVLARRLKETEQFSPEIIAAALAQFSEPKA
jgi:excisionase family DNA binding protein